MMFRLRVRRNADVKYYFGNTKKIVAELAIFSATPTRIIR